ncbi:MAG: class I SAM-dependent methyltransferase [Pyrinomonadaceae bacterium]|nr:class I SAM-dependent methyltransferase [Phycisphaerales bacterium]
MSNTPSSTHAGKRGVTPELLAAVDFGRTSDDYARFRPGPPASFYERLDAMKSLAGLDVADIGAGTGLVGIELAKRGARVVAVDPSREQLDQAARSAQAARVQLRVQQAKAEATGLPDASVNLYIASQAWHWFDPVKAGAEARRLLKPGGFIVTVSFDYLPGRSEVARMTESLILKYNTTWPLADGNGCHIRPLYDLPAAGFIELQQFSYEHQQVFTHEGWRGRMRTCNGVGASLPREQVQAFDADLATLLREHFPDPVGIAHRVWVVVARQPETAP